MSKIDFASQQKHLYAPSAKQPALVEVPELLFLMIDGDGDPNSSPAYQGSVSALYSLAYGLKFRIKKNGGPDYAVLPLEGLWWVDDLSQLNMQDKSNWHWTMMIRQPEEVTPDLLEEQRAEVIRKKGLPAAGQVRLERFSEGLAAQVLHLGPYAAEMPTVERLHRFVEQSGYRLHGRHHEIYLSDPNRSAPEKLRTILRNPVAPL